MRFMKEDKNIQVGNLETNHIFTMDLETFIAKFQKNYILQRDGYIQINKQQILYLLNQIPLNEFHCFLKDRNAYFMRFSNSYEKESDEYLCFEVG